MHQLYAYCMLRMAFLFSGDSARLSFEDFRTKRMMCTLGRFTVRGRLVYNVLLRDIVAGPKYNERQELQ